MANKLSPGARFRKALKENQPLQIVGTINAYAAMMAERVGHQAIYLSGGGVANASYGLPDLGMTTMNDVVEDVRRITAATDVPLLVISTPVGAEPSTSAVPSVKWNAPVLLRFISKTRLPRNAVATARTRKSFPKRKWSTASRLRPMPGKTKISSSWPVPMPSRKKVWKLRLTAPRPALKPVQTVSSPKQYTS